MVLLLAFATWIVGCAPPDLDGSKMGGSANITGDDDDEPTPAKKKKAATTPSGSPVNATTGTSRTADTTSTPTVPVTPTTTPTTTPAPTTTPTTTPAPTTAPTTTPAPAPTPDPTPAPVTHTTFSTTANLNLREGPSTSDAIILTMPSGSEVEAVEETPTNNWYHVTYQGQDGWASGSYLQEL